MKKERRKKVMQVWTDMTVSKLWQTIHLWVNYPFNLCDIQLQKKSVLINTVYQNSVGYKVKSYLPTPIVSNGAGSQSLSELIIPQLCYMFERV